MKPLRSRSARDRLGHLIGHPAQDDAQHATGEVTSRD